jgi:hypothetical protein
MSLLGRLVAKLLRRGPEARARITAANILQNIPPIKAAAKIVPTAKAASKVIPLTADKILPPIIPTVKMAQKLASPKTAKKIVGPVVREYYASGRIKPLKGAYQRRIASAERRNPGVSRNEARGKVSPKQIEAYAIQKNHIPKGIDANDYRAAINGAVYNLHGDPEGLRKLRATLQEGVAIRALDKDDPTKKERGRKLWESKEDWMPPEMFYYN